MGLSPGEKLGPYEILSPLGAGGMGEVYKARDPRLDRFVAVKVLPGHIASRENLRQRFEREARAVASLNHPHICVLFDIGNQDGVGYLVMEYLEGETLAARIRRGALPLNHALDFAAQTADALDRAHRAGVTHRDIKPSNIMLTRDGVKVLDFGLAKSESKPAASDDTLTEALTVEGSLLGTPQYMAPEQVQANPAHPADARTDIYALGLLVHEMVTGRHVVKGNSAAEMMASVIRDEPEPLHPPDLNRLMRKCLEKDPDKRWQSAADLRDALGWVAQDLSKTAVPTLAPKKSLLTWVPAAVLAVAFVGSVAMQLRKPPPVDAPVRRFTITDNDVWYPAISPNGALVAYVNHRETQSELVLYDIRHGARRVAVTAARSYLASPFWSPDSKSVGYLEDSSLRRYSVAGGGSDLIYELPSPSGGSYFFGASYYPDGESMVFSIGNPARLFQMSVRGGTPTPLPNLNLNGMQDVFFDAPLFLPGPGASLLFSKSPRGTLRSELVLANSDGSSEVSFAQGSRSAYSPTGHVVFANAGDLWARAIQKDPWKGLGDPFLVAQSAGSNVSISTDNTLVYVREIGGGVERLIFKDRQGRTVGELGQPQMKILAPRLSPDQKSAAVSSPDSGALNIWIHTAGKKTRFTFEERADRPAWHPGGQLLSFSSGRGGNTDIYLQRLDGSSPARRLVGTEGGDYGFDWSADGKTLVGTAGIAGTSGNVYTYRQKESSEWEAVPFLETKFDEYSAMLSPDGKYLAYTSNESGRYEVYVRQFPLGGKWQVSTDGGIQPHWRGDGKEMFYADGDNMMAVPVALNPTFYSGTPTNLFQHKGLSRNRGHQYDVFPDGQKFLLVEVLKEPDRAIQLVENWFAEFRGATAPAAR